MMPEQADDHNHQCYQEQQDGYPVHTMHHAGVNARGCRWVFFPEKQVLRYLLKNTFHKCPFLLQISPKFGCQ